VLDFPMLDATIVPANLDAMALAVAHLDTPN
jgi:hypothetical protein